MYKKGDIKFGTANGSRLDQESEWPKKPVFHLEHSCDEWIIGGIGELELMVEDLNKEIERQKEDK